MSATRRAALVRLEVAEVVRSRWLVFCAGLYAVLAALFLLVGLRESDVLGFTGMGRVLLSLAHVLVVLLPLVALTGTVLSVNRARLDGTLELLFGHPVSRSDYFGAVTLVRYGVLLLPLFALMPGLALFGAIAFHQAIDWGFLARALGVCAALLWSFTGIGLAISTLVRDAARATMAALLAWVLGVALLDFGLIGLMLQWRLPPWLAFTLAAANPVETARVALLATAQPSLGVLGPVGFYLAGRLGPAWLLVLGVLWPVAAGTLAWWIGRRRFRLGDLV